MNFNATGDMYLLIVTCAVFVPGFLISLAPLSKRGRVWLLVAGPVGWIIWLLFASPAGEDGLAWAIIGGLVSSRGLPAWWSVTSIHRMFHPSPSGSLRTRLYRLITLR
jgi:hypothetical protein